MGKPQRRKKMHYGDTHLQRRWRTRSRKRDLDLIDSDVKNNQKALLNQPVDLDKPGCAQFYCIHCAKYFINTVALQAHFKTKVHKRRLKALELEPYTVEESERAAGYGSFTKSEKRIVTTQPIKNVKTDESDDVDKKAQNDRCLIESIEKSELAMDV